MKTKILFALLVLAATSITLKSCLKDTATQTYQLYRPIIESAVSVRAKIKTDIPQPIKNAGKLFVKGNTIFLNEIDKGIHIIDNSNPANPVNTAFINIPGNVDVAVKDNILYADCFADIVAIDISNPSNVTVVNVQPDLFSDRRYLNGYYVDSGMVITGWIVKDTTVNISANIAGNLWAGGVYYAMNTNLSLSTAGGVSSTGPNASNSNGVAGSMSRFAIQNNYLYAVSRSTLNCLNIQQASTPIIENKLQIGWNIETIYPFKDKLFIGSQSGMFIYSVSNPAAPQYLSGFSHARLCDPVIADNNYAYVTLHAGETRCSGTDNEMDVLDISNISSPTLVKKVNLTKPQGLSKDGNTLIVCDNDAGIKIFDATNPDNPILTQTLAMQAAYDVICYNGIAILSAKDGLYQFDYSNPALVKQIGKLNY